MVDVEAWAGRPNNWGVETSRIVARCMSGKSLVKTKQQLTTQPTSKERRAGSLGDPRKY
jgi:hypothetical protein